jgi:hypothetical protein
MNVRDLFMAKRFGGGSGGSGGVVVCEKAVVTSTTSLGNLQGVRLRLPNATSIGDQAFYGCTALTSVDLPVATSIGVSAFYGCTALTSVDLPVATSIGACAFQGCTALTSVDLPAATSIGDLAFDGCTNLSAVILRNAETVCQIIATAALGTKIATAEGAPTGEGFVYVPTTLYEGYVELLAYQAAQLVGDAATAEYIARALLRKIEDYPDICG